TEQSVLIVKFRLRLKPNNEPTAFFGSCLTQLMQPNHSRTKSQQPNGKGFCSTGKKNRFQAAPQVTQNLTVFCLQ
ncbi:hypothetical protein, partial [Kingella kingae]|uniref:hypothetical protein n=1 Tax=Kingella kingae TaxID=504 RepID=UPI0025513C2A